MEYKSEEIKEFRFFQGQKITKIEDVLMYYNEYDLIDPLYRIGCTNLKNFRITDRLKFEQKLENLELSKEDIFRAK